MKLIRMPMVTVSAMPTKRARTRNISTKRVTVGMKVAAMMAVVNRTRIK